MKKVCSLLLVLAVAAAMLLSFAGCGGGPSASQGLEFTSNGDGTCTWKGLGTCTDTEIVVPEKNGEETVTAVGSWVLDHENDKVTKVTLPNSVTVIEGSAFKGSLALETVVLGNAVTTIEHSAFEDCSKLQAVNFPATLQAIDFSAFEDCTALTEVHLPNGLTTLGIAVFKGCSGVKKLSLPSSIGSVYFKNMSSGSGGSADFDTTSLEEVNLLGNWEVYDMLGYVTGSGANTEIVFNGYLKSGAEVTGTASEHAITGENMKAVVCALFNKKALIINGENYIFAPVKPEGSYTSNYAGNYGKQTFSDEDTLTVYDTYSKAQIASDSYTYDEETGMYTYTATGTTENGLSVTLKKVFVSFGNVLYSEESINGIRFGRSNGVVGEWVKE